MAEHKTARRRQPRFELIAGHVCLDFVNTLNNRPSDQPTELLTTHAAFVYFAEDSGFLSAEDAYYLLDHARRSPEKAEQALRKAIALREAMFDVFSAVMKKESLPLAAFETLNACIQQAGAQARLVQIKGRFESRFEYLSSLESLLWPIARAAADLLMSDQLRYMRACMSPTCEWMFLDTSKNHRRRWCDMNSCGNRAKARRFYKRQKRA